MILRAQGLRRYLRLGLLAVALAAASPNLTAETVEERVAAPVATLPQPAVGSPALAGQWMGELPIDEGETSRLVLDLGMIGSRWVGEFDLVQVGVENYPVEVAWVGQDLKLHFAGIDADFAGTIASDGQTLVVTQEGDESVTLKRAGEAQFSEWFLKLEAAADDSTRVAGLSPNAGELKARFNADRELTRLVVLLSPT
jgi:hypothetical protein